MLGLAGFRGFFFSFLFNFILVINALERAGGVCYVPAQPQPGLLPAFLVADGFVVQEMRRTARNMGMWGILCG